MDNQIQILVVMVIYMAFLIFWGFYHGRKVKTASDFAIADRKLPGWVAALSERSTGESSWALLGLPGAAYATGLMEVWTAIGCFLGVVVSWVFLAWRLRNEAEKFQVSTFTEYISLRHQEMGKWIRVIGSLTIVFFFFFYVGAQFLGGGKTLENIFGIPREYGMVIIVAMVIPYTIYGGFRSVTYTDVIQAIIMIIALVVTPVVGIIYLGQQAEGQVFAQSIWEGLQKSGAEYTSMTNSSISLQNPKLLSFLDGIFPQASELVQGLTTIVIVLGAFSWFFGFLGGQPQLSMRFMAIKSPSEARKARNISILWTLLAYTGALLIGWLGIAIFGPNGLKDQETVMPEMLTLVFHPIIAGILITGILAAIISTANSLLILSSTELYENLIKPFQRKTVEGKKALNQSRLVTGILSVIALLLAYITPTQMVFSIVSYVWAGIGNTFSVVILLTLFWKRFHGKAAFNTIFGGMAFTIVWISTGMEAYISTRFLTFFIALGIAIVSTLLLKKQD
jgi:sodium/proline symporter